MGMYSETVQCVTVYSVTVYSTYCAVTEVGDVLSPVDAVHILHPAHLPCP